MAKLINGNGNPAVYANEDSDWFAAIMGNQTSITAIGEQFRADQADANTIEVFDGVIITKEGRRIQLDANQVDLFEIPTGTQGQTNYYIIGYHLYTDTDANQFCEVFVQLMESASDTIPEDTFRGGADDVYISLYRVTQDGLNIDSIDLLLPTISTISKINADLTDLKTYTTSEKAIGKWVDGKTIYRKSGYVSSGYSSGLMVLDATLNNSYVENVISMYGSIVLTNGEILGIAGYSSNAYRNNFGVNTSGFCKIGDSITNGSKILWNIEYTKVN